MKITMTVLLVSACLLGTALAQNMGGGSTAGSSTSGGSVPTANVDNSTNRVNGGY